MMLLDVVWATIPDSAHSHTQGQDSWGVGNGSEAFQHLELSNTNGFNPALQAPLF